MAHVAILIALAVPMLVSYRYVSMGAIPDGMVKAPECERHHVVMDAVNETLWSFSPYNLRRHELRLLNPQDNVELLIPGQMLCVKALEKEENYRPHLEYQNYMEKWSRVVNIEVTAHGTNETKYCTGTFLDERTVITTASCVLKIATANVKVVLRHSSELQQQPTGESRIVSVPPSKASVERIVAHPQYSPETGQSHNVAVLFLKKKAKLDSMSRKLELPTPSADNAEKTKSVKETYVVQRNYVWQEYALITGTKGFDRYDDFYLSDDLICTVMDPDEYHHNVCHEGNGAPLVLFDEGLKKHFLIGVGVATSGDCTNMQRGHDYIFVDLRHKSNWEWLRKTTHPRR